MIVPPYRRSFKTNHLNYYYQNDYYYDHGNIPDSTTIRRMPLQRYGTYVTQHNAGSVGLMPFDRIDRRSHLSIIIKQHEEY
jgi:hypothetical protein